MVDGYGYIPQKTLTVIDFSGTLSLDAVMFSRTGTLERALRESGLADLGITTPAVFWNELVGPTWEEGSLTQKGYINILAEHILKYLHNQGDPSFSNRIYTAVSRLANAYFAHSRIDPHWKPALEFLNSRATTVTVIATDHYAEATNHIINELAGLGMEARPPGKTSGNRGFLVANSADLGHHKSRKEFWVALKRDLGAFSFARTLLIDDFGYNEQEEAVYGESSKVLSRRERTTEILADIFQTELYTFPFFLEHSRKKTGSLWSAFHDLIEQAYNFIKAYCA